MTAEPLAMAVEWHREGRFIYFTLHGPKLATPIPILPVVALKER